MQALIEDATGKVLGWGITVPAAVAGQMIVQAPDNLNLVDRPTWRYNAPVVKAVTSVTRVNQLVTVTTAAPHGLVDAQLVTIAGAVQLEYNGTFVILVTGASTFTYSIGIAQAPVTPATGTITVTPVAGFRNVTSAEGVVEAGLAKDSVADALLGVGTTNPLVDAVTLKAALSAIVSITYDKLDAIRIAAGQAAGVIGNKAAFAAAIKTDFRARL